MDDSDGANGTSVHGRPPGRGLEEVSHLLLSTQAPRESVVLLRPAQVTRDRLAAILPLDWSGAIEDGLRTIDTRIPCHPCGEIDVLAADRAGRLTVIDFDALASDGLLLRGLGHVDWVARNAEMIRRMCRGQVLDASLAPRLILLAPQFSLPLRRIMRQLARTQIQCFRYHVVETPAGAGMFFEAVSAD
jgi:hypothetical protein